MSKVFTYNELIDLTYLAVKGARKVLEDAQEAHDAADRAASAARAALYKAEREYKRAAVATHAAIDGVRMLTTVSGLGNITLSFEYAEEQHTLEVHENLPEAARLAGYVGVIGLLEDARKGNSCWRRCSRHTRRLQRRNKRRRLGRARARGGRVTPSWVPLAWWVFGLITGIVATFYFAILMSSGGDGDD